MTRNELEQHINNYLARGGEIKKVPEGLETHKPKFNPWLNPGVYFLNKREISKREISYIINQHQTNGI